MLLSQLKPRAIKHTWTLHNILLQKLNTFLRTWKKREKKQIIAQDTLLSSRNIFKCGYGKKDFNINTWWRKASET